MKTWQKVIAGGIAVGGAAGTAYLLYKAYDKARSLEEFRKLGDVNYDNIIDQKDLDLIMASYSATQSSPNWNPRADLNGDGIVDVRDYVICGNNQGLTYEEWLKTR